MATLLYNHIIKLLLERRYAQNSQSYHFILENMTSKQQQKLKGSIVNMNNQLNGIFSIFDSLNIVLYLGYRLIDTFSSHISIHSSNCNSYKNKVTHCKKLNEIIFEASSDPRIVVIISDTSIKNNITFSIFYIHSFNNLLKKMLYHTINITSTEAKLIAIRCSINQIVQIQYILCIIVITYVIYITKKIFDPSVYLY